MRASMRDDNAARLADEFNRQQAVRIRRPDGTTTTQQPCPNLIYCNNRRMGMFPPQGGYCKTCPKRTELE